MSQRLDQYSDCRLHAYADDELDAQEKAAIKDLINYDAEVARRVEDYQALNRDLKLHFGFVVEEPVPKRLLDVVQAESQFLQQYTSTGDITEAKTLVIDRQLAPFPAGSGKTAARENTQAADSHTDDNTVIYQPRRRAVDTSRAESSWPLRAAAMIAWMALGTMLGFVVYNHYSEKQLGVYNVAQLALDAHIVYSNEKKHAVEVGATDREHLMTWLSKRLGEQVGPPDLSDFDLEFMGGRLLPVQGKPAGQYMYRNTAGNRLSLYMSSVTNKDNTESEKLQCYTVTQRHVCTWTKQPVSYFVISEVPLNSLRSIAASARKQLLSQEM